MNVKLILSYNGKNYHGWQIQNKDGDVRSDSPTVQGVLLRALKEILGDDTVELSGVSRTDAGVHADMFCASFTTANEKFPMDRLPFAIAHLLPDDIVVTQAEVAPDDFHARFSCKGKKYRYRFYTGAFPCPLENDFAWYVGRMELDINVMKEACRNMPGTHDFSAFMASGNTSKTTVRTIFDCDINEKPCDHAGVKMYELEVTGDGFLYNMVRIITGTVFDCGRAKIAASDIPAIINSCDRSRAGITAPPCGLYLNKIMY